MMACYFKYFVLFLFLPFRKKKLQTYYFDKKIFFFETKW